jgi:hypothetical protein
MAIAYASQQKALGKTTPVWSTTDPQQTQVSVGLTPFIRENDIEFSAKNLKPDTTANFFFDDISVNNFCQRASVINVTSSLVLANLRINEGVFNTTSNAYVQVLGTSRTATSNLIYVNENFISMNLVQGGSPTFSIDEYGLGDLVYQTSTGSAYSFSAYAGYHQPQFEFLGKVVKWKAAAGSSRGTLVVDPILGTLNTSATVANNIYNLTKPDAGLRHANNIFATARFNTGSTIVYAANDVTITTLSAANAYIAVSGALARINVGNLNSVTISTTDLARDGLGSTLVNKKITIVSGNNMGFTANVLSNATTANGYVLTLDEAAPINFSSNSLYSIQNHVVDDVGSLYGIFHIPSDNNLRWLAGERLFTITDTATQNDNGYTMRAVSKYTALGKVNSTENARNFVLREQTPSTAQAAPSVIQETQKINDRKFMAQTFFTPKSSDVVNGQVKSSYGIYVTSVDLYFKSKPTDAEEQLPFTVAISKVESGVPSNDIIAERTLEPAYVNVSANTPALSNTTVMTKFSFSDPVYLLPSNEYAIKLITESTDYEVWTAVLGGEYTDVVGNVRKISEQPYVGNLFKSQNASNWNPILNQDLMFRVNRAVFETSNTVYFGIKSDEDHQRDIYMDEIRIAATEQQLAPTSVTYDVKTYTAQASAVPTAQDYINVTPNEVYKFGKDTNVSSVNSNRRRIIPKANSAYSNVRITLSTTDDRVSPIVNRERLGLFAIQNIINNAGISNNMISITNAGTHYTAANIAITFSAPDVGANTATANVLSSMLSSGKITGINIINPGAGYFNAPTITVVEAAATANGTDATAIVNGENNTSGGNIFAGYQTKIVELAEGIYAGDLIVRLDVVRPPGTDVGVYFKVLSPLDKDPFVSKKWVKMEKVNDAYSPDQNSNVRLEYRFALDKGEIEYFEGDKSFPLGKVFKYFAIKLRLTAQDPTVVPMVDSLKVLAVPGESELPSIDGGGY